MTTDPGASTMSTLSLSPSFVPSRTPVRTAARLTRRGRVLVVLAFLVVALVLTTALGGWAVATHDSPSPDAVQVLTVQPGDTLYDIAGRLAAPGGVREMVHRIQELNSLPDTSLRVGEQIAVPRGAQR